MPDKRFFSNIPDENTIVEEDHPLPATAWLLVLLPEAVDAVKDSVLVVFDDDRVTGFRIARNHYLFYPLQGGGCC